jgi:hypothetical protein
MDPQPVQRKTQKQLLDIPSAAFRAGYSLRHFRRIIEEDHIPVMRIGQKNFVTITDLETWKSTYGEARFEECLKQLDRLLMNVDIRRGAEPLQDFREDD